MSMNNSQKGSITLFVLISIFFFLVSTTFIFFYSKNATLSQKKQLETIQDEYNVTFEMMEKEYTSTVKN